MWDKINYELGLKIANKEIDDFDLALELMPKGSTKTKDFVKGLNIDVLPDFNIDEFKVPIFFMFRKVPRDLLDVKFERIIRAKQLFQDKEEINIFNVAGDLVSIILNIDKEKILKRNFVQVVGLGIFFLSLLKKL